MNSVCKQKLYTKRGSKKKKTTTKKADRNKLNHITDRCIHWVAEITENEGWQDKKRIEIQVNEQKNMETGGWLCVREFAIQEKLI